MIGIPGLGIKVSLASINDCQEIFNLNQKYLLENIPAGELSNGFIRIPYSFEYINYIAKKGEVVIAKSKNQLIGYYLISNCKIGLLDHQRLMTERLSAESLIDFTRIGYGVQVCIQYEYHNNGLLSNLLNFLVSAVKHKYDYLLCAVSDENPKSINAHLRAGWTLYEYADGKNYLIYKTKTSKA